MEFKYLTPLLILGLGLAACQPQKETVRETIRETAPTGLPPQPEATSAGPIDSGGGNGINGKPLESFRRDIREIGEMQEIIDPLIEKISKVSSQLAGELLYIANERQWYFVPIKLETLPSKIIGVHFNTDQLALQNLGEVWVDDVKFNAKDVTDQDRARLLLHEMVMGVRLLDFKSNDDQCAAFANQEIFKEEKQRKYDAIKDHCLGQKRDNSAVLEPKRVHLAEEDYINIRALVTLLTAKLDKYDSEKLDEWLKEKNFRNHMY